jgi:hypothetical protein
MIRTHACHVTLVVHLTQVKLIIKSEHIDLIHFNTQNFHFIRYHLTSQQSLCIFVNLLLILLLFAQRRFISSILNSAPSLLIINS